MPIQQNDSVVAYLVGVIQCDTLDEQFYTQIYSGKTQNLIIDTTDGQVVMKVPEGTQPGKVLRLKGKGIPSLRNSTRGDQLVRIKVVVPQKLNEKQKDALRKFAEISKDNINPEEKGFLFNIYDSYLRSERFVTMDRGKHTNYT